MGPRSICSTQLYWGSYLSCLARSPAPPTRLPPTLRQG